MTTWLLADVGGTNTRVAHWKSGTSPRALGPVSRYVNDDYGTLEDLLAAHLAAHKADRSTRALLAVAGPVTGAPIRLLNINWSFVAAELAADLGLAEIRVINDFHAQARAVQLLVEDERLAMGGGVAVQGAPVAVLGPGTGLGVAGLTPDEHGGFSVICGEGGHVSLPARNAFEAEVLAAVWERSAHCSAERIISGSGLTLLHDVLHGEGVVPAAELSRRAAAGDAKARQTFAVCFDFLGTVASDVALTFGALGGVAITGGIALANRDLFLASGFRARFEDKGRYRDYLGGIPTWLVTAEAPALFGLAWHAARTERPAPR